MSRTTQCRRNLGVLDFLLEIALVAIRTVEPPSTEFEPTHRYRSRNQLASVSHTLQWSPSRKIVQLAFNVSIQQSTVQWFQNNCRRRARFSEVSWEQLAGQSSSKQCERQTPHPNLKQRYRSPSQRIGRKAQRPYSGIFHFYHFKRP